MVPSQDTPTESSLLDAETPTHQVAVSGCVQGSLCCRERATPCVCCVWLYLPTGHSAYPLTHQGAPLTGVPLACESSAARCGPPYAFVLILPQRVWVDL